MDVVMQQNFPLEG
uniref:Uncharacterized protein n=1 Tax=Anguilla anguilla TaxID=7936 RepID=A0A0E9VUH0_ANGAN